MEPIQPMGAAYDEVRECIGRLVAVIRRSSTGCSPVDSDQVEHIQKVIRVLSLSESTRTTFWMCSSCSLSTGLPPVEERRITATRRLMHSRTSSWAALGCIGSMQRQTGSAKTDKE